MENKKVGVLLKLEQETVDRLLEFQNKGVTRAQLIREAIELYLTRFEKGAKDP